MTQLSITHHFNKVTHQLFTFYLICPWLYTLVFLLKPFAIKAIKAILHFPPLLLLPDISLAKQAIKGNIPYNDILQASTIQNAIRYKLADMTAPSNVYKTNCSYLPVLHNKQIFLTISSITKQ